ncbi:tyrosine-type recombinase/integrase [Rickettsia endosymbiont of Ixodes scapularis]|uniref:tyrosine-type recombinase/integrase n=1 Tax=Rickettsia endosymbiont of Ixodes scapularis TaxID=444612 RepID=UPI0001A60748|nr:site-specific integrase [Rickettsia endosymbiont of Ixodes scapularis]EER22573.1 integrase [Rickettsia endosymbiont of Ixodes scapularis]
MTEKLLNFTKDSLHKIEPPKEKRDVYKDSKEAGLILIVSYGGSKIFYLGKMIQKEYCRIKIGRFPDLSIVDARAKAAELKSQIARGINPIEESSKVSNELNDLPISEELTFKELFDKYINNYAKHNIKRWRDCIATMNRQAKHFYPMKISAIQKADIQQTFHNLTKFGKYSANKFLEMLSAIFNKAIEWELLGKNPVTGLKKHKEQSRDRYITKEEAPQFFQALKEEQNQLMKDFILISLYTGARKSNVLSMRWENVSFGNKTWYIADTKNGDPQTVVLIEEAIKILEARKKESESEWVFPSEASSSGHLQEPKKAWKRICTRAGLKDLRLHDLRRTCGSWMAINGASQYVIGKALNHKSPTSTAIYARLSLDPVREFMEKSTSDLTTSKNKNYN